MREPWTDVTDDEMRALLDLCILAGVFLQEHYEPVSLGLYISGQNRKADWFLQQPAR